MRVLVVGANGYLGGRISLYLARQGYSVHALVHHEPEHISNWADRMKKVIVGDATKDRLLNDAVTEDIDCVVFTVSLDHRKSGENIDHTLSVNVGIFWKLLEIYSKFDAGKVIYLSTRQVYGARQEGCEVDLPSPINAYGLTHKYCEDLAALYSHQHKNLKCISLRLSNAYGAPVFPSSNCWWIVTNDLCRSAFEKGKIELLSDGTPQRDFIPISDVCKFIKILITNPSTQIPFDVYNLGAGKTYTILEMAHLVSNVFRENYNEEIPVFLPDGSLSKDSLNHQNLHKTKYDISRAKQLAFSSTSEPRAPIIDVIEFLREHRIT